MDKQHKGVALIVLGLIGFVLRGCWNSVFVPEPVDYPVVDTLKSGYLDSTFSVGDTVMIQLSGSVLRPGVYEVTENQRVGDVLSVAGGVLPNANLDRVNLVRFVADGMRIKIPALSKSISSPLRNEQLALLAIGVDVNFTSLDELSLIPGVGPVMASRIVEYRLIHGSFKTVDDLVQVKGIGSKKLKRIRRYLRF